MKTVPQYGPALRKAATLEPSGWLTSSWTGPGVSPLQVFWLESLLRAASSSSQNWGGALGVLLVSALQACEFAPSSSGQQRGFQPGGNADTAATLSGVQTISDAVVWCLPP